MESIIVALISGAIALAGTIFTRLQKKHKTRTEVLMNCAVANW